MAFHGIMQPAFGARQAGMGVALYIQGGGGGKFKNIKLQTPDGRTLNETFQTNIPVLGESRKAVEELNFKFMTAKSTLGDGIKIGNCGTRYQGI
jgi:long-chain fatty acid transport protein